MWSKNIRRCCRVRRTNSHPYDIGEKYLRITRQLFGIPVALVAGGDTSVTATGEYRVEVEGSVE
jgi:hypothetical protein